MRTIGPRLLALVLLSSCGEGNEAPPTSSASVAGAPPTTTAAAPKPAPAAATPTPSKATPAAPTAPATPAPPEPPATPPTPAVEEVDPSNEKFGELSHGLSLERARELFPHLAAKGSRRANRVDGGILVGYDQQWVAKTSGVTLTMSSETKSSAQTVSSIEIESPSTLRAASGVGIGDTVEAVKKAYADVFEGESENELVVQGGWLTLTIEGGKVAKLRFSEPYLGG